jgi:hypothetical protein
MEPSLMQPAITPACPTNEKARQKAGFIATSTMKFHLTGCTAAACEPFGPSITSKLTF